MSTRFTRRITRLERTAWVAGAGSCRSEAVERASIILEDPALVCAAERAIVLSRSERALSLAEVEEMNRCARLVHDRVEQVRQARREARAGESLNMEG